MPIIAVAAILTLAFIGALHVYRAFLGISEARRRRDRAIARLFAYITAAQVRERLAQAGGK